MIYLEELYFTYRGILSTIMEGFLFRDKILCSNEPKSDKTSHL